MNKRYTNEQPQKLYEEKKWPNSYFRKLVSLYRKSSCLWKKDTAYYLDSEQRYSAYSAIHEGMALPGVTLVEILLKIREMRTLYVTELKRILQAEANGYCYDSVLPWFYDLHRFLYPYLDYDEANELHNMKEANGEFNDGEHCRDSSRNSCVKSLTSDSNTFDSYNDNISPPARDLEYLNSTSSPAVSLPEVRTRLRTCPRSCTKIPCPKKNPDKPSCNSYPITSSSSFCQINRKGISNYCKAATIYEQSRKCQADRSDKEISLDYIVSGYNSCPRGSDQFEIFSNTVLRYLREMDKNFALKAQDEIQKILMDLVTQSNNRKRGMVRFKKVSLPRTPTSRRECVNQCFAYSPILKGSGR